MILDIQISIPGSSEGLVASTTDDGFCQFPNTMVVTNIFLIILLTPANQIAWQTLRFFCSHHPLRSFLLHRWQKWWAMRPCWWRCATATLQLYSWMCCFSTVDTFLSPLSARIMSETWGNISLLPSSWKNAWKGGLFPEPGCDRYQMPDVDVKVCVLLPQQANVMQESVWSMFIRKACSHNFCIITSSKILHDGGDGSVIDISTCMR